MVWHIHPDLTKAAEQPSSPLAMEVLAATPRALFPRASPAALMATAGRTPSARRRCAAPVRASAAAAEPAGEAKPAAAPKAAGDDGAAAAAPKKVLKKKPVYSSKRYCILFLPDS